MNDPKWGRGQGHMTYFLNFGISSVTFERMKLDTSFFFDRSFMASTMMNDPEVGIA